MRTVILTPWFWSTCPFIWTVDGWCSWCLWWLCLCDVEEEWRNLVEWYSVVESWSRCDLVRWSLSRLVRCSCLPLLFSSAVSFVLVGWGCSTKDRRNWDVALVSDCWECWTLLPTAGVAPSERKRTSSFALGLSMLFVSAIYKTLNRACSSQLSSQESITLTIILH